MRPPRGTTLLETLVILAVLAVVATLVWGATLGGGSAARDAEAVRAELNAARRQALGGTPRAVVWEAERRRWQRRAGADPATVCAQGRVTDALRPHPRTRVTATLRDGVVWLPDGTGRACAGGGVYGGRITLEDARQAWSLVVASSGRIRRERLR